MWEQRSIRVFGREIPQPRLIGWAGALPYRYSGQTLEPRPLEPVLTELMDRVNAACGVTFNHILLNRYRDGRDAMGVHADNEPELGPWPTIAAISLGAVRPFLIEPKEKRGRKKHRKRIPLQHGSLLVMGGRMQHTWRHAVPRVNGLDQERVNLTFRVLRGPPGWRGQDPSPA